MWEAFFWSFETGYGHLHSTSNSAGGHHHTGALIKRKNEDLQKASDI